MLVDVRKLKQGANVVDIVDKALRMGEGHQLKILENVAKASVAMKDTTAALMNSLLQEASLQGAGYQAQFPGMHIAAKTGSTDSSKDRCFAGYTPYYSCAVWAEVSFEHRSTAPDCRALTRAVESS